MSTKTVPSCVVARLAVALGDPTAASELVEVINEALAGGGGGAGTVTSVGLTMPPGLSVAGSPVTGAGTLAVTTTLSGLVQASGGALSAATIGSGLTFSGGTLAASGGGGTPAGSDGQVQFNSGGAFAALSGTAATTDINGPTDAVAIGSGSFALGEQSLAVGYQCIASCDWSVATGGECTAGASPRGCTISGTTVTISGGDYTSWFYGGDDGELVLWQLSGGTGPTIVYGSIDGDAAGGGVVFDGTDTVLTLLASVTSHTAGVASMRDSGTAAHASGIGCVAIGPSSHAEGYFTTASGHSSHAEGNHATASAPTAHAEGIQTTASAQAAHAEGSQTTASGASSYAGGANAVASLLFQWARSDGDTIPGQASQVYASGRTPGADPVNLLIGTSDFVAIATNRAFGFVAQITAYKIDGSAAAMFLRQGLIKNVGGTTTLVGSVGTIGTDINAASWSVAITADAGNNALQLAVTGEATVDWQARIDFVEVG